MKPINYEKFHYKLRSSRDRYRKRAEKSNLICQECGGIGGETDVILDDGTGPFNECGWCAGTGYVTPWARGEWLRLKKWEKKEARKAG